MSDSTHSMHSEYARRVTSVTGTRGFVALWDFVKHETPGAQRFVAHVPVSCSNAYALDAMNYIREFWGKGRAATYEDFPLLGRGPFGQAIRIHAERDETFRPLLLVPRSRLHDSPLDIKGPGRSVSMIVWAIRESGCHALAGIWHEGTDLHEPESPGVQRIERGRRQYGLFAGLGVEGAALGHVSENGGSSFGCKWAHHCAITPECSLEVPGDSPAHVLDQSWTAFAFTFDRENQEVVAYLNGVASPMWKQDARTRDRRVYNAWMKGQHLLRPGEVPDPDPQFPAEQAFMPPEDAPVSIQVLHDTLTERVELQEFAYTRVQVRYRKNSDGTITLIDRDLQAVRHNPWWFPHDLWSPPSSQQGGPFTIGRVIHSACSVGFTGYIGGVAVFDRALSAEEVSHLSAIGCGKPIALPPKPTL